MSVLIKRSIEQQLLQNMAPNKVLVLLGPRRVGKTVLLRQLSEAVGEPFLLLNGEDADVRERLARRSRSNYLNLLGDIRMLFIDEAQKIPEVGKMLKLMVDEIDGIRILATGSSAFDINVYTGEPLTGRKKTYHLFPLAEKELDQVENPIEKAGNLRQRLVFGNYPELLHLHTESSKKEYLQELVNAYLLKDILEFEQIRNADKLLRLLRLIAFQVGSEVSYNELGRQLSMSKNTVERYLDLLSKVFVIHSVSAFSRNLRKEISKGKKWYFYDNGIRNILAGNMNPLALRDDVGLLWENHIIGERIKYQHYRRMLVYNYFWRTYDQQEIDWIEDRDGKLHAYEFKWSPTKRAGPPTAWKAQYTDSRFELINRENYRDWL